MYVTVSLYGNKDDLIAIEYAYLLHSFLKQQGNKSSQLVILEGIGHGGPAYNEVMNNRMETIVNFLKQNK